MALEIGFQFRRPQIHSTSGFEIIINVGFRSFPEGAAMQTGNNATAQFSPACGADSKVDVILETREGAERVVLRYSRWGEGLAWCAQRPFSVDPPQFKALPRAPRVARPRLNRQRAEAGQAHTPAQVIQLPTLA